MKTPPFTSQKRIQVTLEPGLAGALELDPSPAIPEEATFTVHTPGARFQPSRAPLLKVHKKAEEGSV